MPSKGLDVVQIRLVMDKTLYSEEQLSSPERAEPLIQKPTKAKHKVRRI